jgi:predicted nucleotidyltransferase
MRVGFTSFRKQMLERELDRIIEIMPILGIEKAILVGDMVTGKYSPDSQIDLVIVHKTDRPFGRRADFFSYHLNSSVAVDTQVYTPEEFETLKETNPTLRQVVEKGRVIFDA